MYQTNDQNHRPRTETNTQHLHGSLRRAGEVYRRQMANSLTSITTNEELSLSSAKMRSALILWRPAACTWHQKNPKKACNHYSEHNSTFVYANSLHTGLRSSQYSQPARKSEKCIKPCFNSTISFLQNDHINYLHIYTPGPTQSRNDRRRGKKTCSFNTIAAKTASTSARRRAAPAPAAQNAMCGVEVWRHPRLEKETSSAPKM